MNCLVEGLGGDWGIEINWQGNHRYKNKNTSF